MKIQRLMLDLESINTDLKKEEKTHAYTKKVLKRLVSSLTKLRFPETVKHATVSNYYYINTVDLASVFARKYFSYASQLINRDEEEAEYMQDVFDKNLSVLTDIVRSVKIKNEKDLERYVSIIEMFSKNFRLSSHVNEEHQKDVFFNVSSTFEDALLANGLIDIGYLKHSFTISTREYVVDARTESDTYRYQLSVKSARNPVDSNLDVINANFSDTYNEEAVLYASDDRAESEDVLKFGYVGT